MIKEEVTVKTHIAYCDDCRRDLGDTYYSFDNDRRLPRMDNNFYICFVCGKLLCDKCTITYIESQSFSDEFGNWQISTKRKYFCGIHRLEQFGQYYVKLPKVGG